MQSRRSFLAQAVAIVLSNAQTTNVFSATSATTGKKSIRAQKVPRTDLMVSRIAYGCGDLGGWNNAPPAADTIGKAVRLINAAYDNGITLFDLADIYGFGASEAVFGEVLRRSPGLRKSIVIQTKFGRLRPLDRQLVVDTSYEHIVRSAEGSLRRLGTDHLDILLLHQPDELIELQEVASAFDELKHSGKVRYFGVSNHTPHQIDLLQNSVQQPLVINQLRLGLAHSQPFTDGTVAYCRKNGIQVQAYSPVRGLSKHTQDATLQIKEVEHALTELAVKRNTSPYAIALAWLLRHPSSIVPVIGATNPEHIVDNCAADNITLSRDEWYTLFRTASKAWP